ncbi:MAG TPA: thiamine phosphate synthase [Acidimicrobiales bacterium]|nr:thiamine phosphate synthase [Acidimicrobiales bacterium]
MPAAERAGSDATGGLTDRRLYLCTPDRPDLTAFLTACIAGGVDVVQLREKQLEARQLIARAVLAAEVCGQFGVPFILNDRPDLVLACSASGVHVGQDDVPPQIARSILGSEAIVGLSTHARREWDAAIDGNRAAAGVDYLSAGPVNETPTKPGRAGTGLSYLEYVASTPAGSPGGVPWFVTGGVTPETVPDMASAGAGRFVVVRYLTESDDPQRAAGRLREAIERCTG